jgi:hypothetical protein
MTVVQITRDSVSSVDGIRAPHVMAARLSPAPVLAELVEWVVAHHYLAGLPEGDTWVLHLGSRVGTPAARMLTRVTDVPSVDLAVDGEHSLAGVGSVHLEWISDSENMED